MFYFSSLELFSQIVPMRDSILTELTALIFFIPVAGSGTWWCLEYWWLEWSWLQNWVNLCSDQAWSTATLTTWDLSSSEVKSLSQVPGFERLTVAYSDLCKVRWAGTPYAKISLHVNHWYLASRVWGPTSLPTTTSLPFTVNLTSSSTPWVKFAMLSSLFSGHLSKLPDSLSRQTLPHPCCQR